MLLLLSTPLYPQTLLLPVFLNKTLVSPPISPVFITIDLSLSVVCSLTYLSSSSPVGHSATTILLHKVLSFAAGCALPHESPISISSIITVFRRVVFGHPDFLLPCGVRLRATLGILSLFILRTCPSHLNRRRLVSRTSVAARLMDFHIRYFIGPEYPADLSQVCSLSMSFPLL